MNKICIKCGIEDDSVFFVKKENICKECKKHYNQKYKADHLNDRSVYYVQYYIDNKDYILSQTHQYYKNNKDEILLRQKQYDQDHESVSNYRKQYREDHKEDIKKYYNLNQDKLKKYHNEYMKERNKNDPAFKLRGNCSKLINFALKGKKINKSILKYLPYSMDELKNHIEKQFDEYMSWDNYGSYWHIDHIYPQSKLPYTSMEDDNFKQCWALDNLRPLEKIANIKKSNKIINNIVRNL